MFKITAEEKQMIEERRKAEAAGYDDIEWDEVENYFEAWEDAYYGEFRTVLRQLTKSFKSGKEAKKFKKLSDSIGAVIIANNTLNKILKKM